MVGKGQLYIDKMFRCELEVVGVDEYAVFLKDTAKENGSGSPYPHDEFEVCVESGRFKRVDHLLGIETGGEEESKKEAQEEIEEEAENFEEAMEMDNDGVYQDEDDGIDPNEFEPQDALNW